MFPRMRRRLWVWLTLLGSGATMFQVIGGFTDANGATRISCRDFWVNGLSTSVDFCYLLDCQNGFFGGLVQPCGDPTTAADDLLVDCPGTTTGNTNGTGTNNTGGTGRGNTGR